MFSKFSGVALRCFTLSRSTFFLFLNIFFIRIYDIALKTRRRVELIVQGNSLFSVVLSSGIV